MLSNDEILNTVLTKGVIAGVIAGVADYQLGRFASPTALMFGGAVGLGVSLVSLTQLQKWDNTKELKATKFIVSRVSETIGAVTLAYSIDPTSWKHSSNVHIFNAILEPKHNNLTQRLSIILAADIIAGVVVESINADTRFRYF